jgi:hypothetical protein
MDESMHAVSRHVTVFVFVSTTLEVREDEHWSILSPVR